MRIAGDIGAAMGKLMPLKDDHAFILYEQQGEEDIRSIRFLRSWFPGAGIVLITSGRLTGEERRAYLRREQRRAGRHIARRFPPHTAIHDRLYIRPQTRRRRRERSTVVPHAALETGVRHRGIARGDPPALAPAHSRGRGRQTRQPGAGHLQVETRGKQLPDLRFPEVPLDALRRRPAAQGAGGSEPVCLGTRRGRRRENGARRRRDPQTAGGHRKRHALCRRFRDPRGGSSAPAGNRTGKRVREDRERPPHHAPGAFPA